MIFWDSSNKNFTFFNISISKRELFLLAIFILFHIANIPSLRFHYNDMEILGNLYRFESIAKIGMTKLIFNSAYGPLLWHLHGIFYKMMPPGVFSTNIILLVVSPIISLFIGYICARLIFKNNFSRICFLIISMFLFTYTESWYYSCRIWMGLLSLALFSSGIVRIKKYYLFLSALSLVTAFFISFEIAIYAFASIFIIIAIMLFLEKKEFWSIRYFIYGLFLGIIFFIVLYHKFIIEFLSYLVIQSKHYNWAMGWPFPGLFDERHKVLFGYFRPLIVHLLGLLFIISIFLRKKIESKKYIIKLLLFVLFGFFSYRTVLSRSDDGHLHFILAPALIILMLLVDISLSASQRKRNFIEKNYLLNSIILTITILFFFRNIFINEISIYKSRFRLLPKSNESFYPALGIFLKNEVIQELQEVSNYINTNTSMDDYIYVFPRGPYYYLTGRKKPSVYLELHALYTRKMRQDLVEALEKNQVQYIINPIIWFPDMNNLLFAKEIEDYVQNRFSLEKEISHTLIFKRRASPLKTIKPLLIKEWKADDLAEIRLSGLSGRFGEEYLKVTGKKCVLEFICPPSSADTVEIEIGLLAYFPSLQTLAKPNLELISYDNNGMIAYEKVNIPTDGEKYPIRYKFKKTREITKLIFILSNPGLFNPQASRIYLGKVSLFLDKKEG